MLCKFDIFLEALWQFPTKRVISINELVYVKLECKITLIFDILNLFLQILLDFGLSFFGMTL